MSKYRVEFEVEVDDEWISGHGHLSVLISNALRGDWYLDRASTIPSIRIQGLPDLQDDGILEHVPERIRDA